MSFDMSNYVDVAERIRLAMEKWPEASFQNQGTIVVMVKDRPFVQVTVALYRDPQDVRPAIATAWEPIPGATPYTRDSEMMNAETSAMGRAVIAAGIPSKKVASAEDVRNRQQPTTTQFQPPDDEVPDDPWATHPGGQSHTCKHGDRKQWTSPDGKVMWFCQLPKGDADKCATEYPA